MTKSMARSKSTDVLLLLLLLAVSISAVCSSPEEGKALVEMMNEWNVTFPTWIPGSDPCDSKGDWEYITCTNGRVTNLTLSRTGISGRLPKAIGELSALQTLVVLRNNLYGELPQELALCQDLTYLDISRNNWGINFPMVVTKLGKLEFLYAIQAALTGTLPKALYRMKTLKYLYLGNNTQLTGNLESFSQLTNLVNLTVWQMQWDKYELPDTLSLLTNLEYFNCHDCNLVGPLPPSWGNLRNLVDLQLRNNKLTGVIPESYKNMTRMYSFRVDSNVLLAPFPNWVFTSWPNLTYLYLSRNLLYGIPDNISYLEQNFDIANKMSIMRWECNYLRGPQPCRDNGTNICSEETVNKTQLPAGLTGLFEVAQFSFGQNCYDDIDPSYLQQVENCGDHLTIGACTDFQTNVLEKNICPPCPRNQESVRGTSVADGCRCRLQLKSESGFSSGTIVGIVVGVTVFFLVLVGFLIYYKRKEFKFLDIFTTKNSDRFDGDWEAPEGVHRFTVEELARITSDFHDSHIVGVGGFGKVYWGLLDDGHVVAIKRASPDGLEGHSEFRNEVTLLSRLHHRHLVKLEGFCDEKDFQLLVFEFMKGGNLSNHLYGDRKNEENMKIKEGWFTPLPWYKRVEIAYQVALGLEYLHSFAEPTVIHRDVKPSNILLDENMVAKLADFGISKAFGDASEETHLSTRPAGTAGYLDPEYFLRRQLTKASDVYAYGVVLLELITGQLAIDHKREDEYNLIEWAKKRFKTAGIISIIDPRISEDYSREAFTRMTNLALRCSAFSKSERPTMKEVLAELDPFISKTEKMSTNTAYTLSEEDLEFAKRNIYAKFSGDTEPTVSSVDTHLSASSSEAQTLAGTEDLGPR